LHFSPLGYWLLYGCFIRNELDGNAKDGKGQKAHKLKNRDVLKSLKTMVKIHFFLVKKEWW